MNQSSLAKVVGCKQSAISALENGDATKLSEDTINKIAEYLNVSLEAPKKEEQTIILSPPSAMIVRGFCPDANCPSNIPFMVGNRLVFHPSRAKSSPNGGGRCACCGEVLERCCPVCSAPLNEGACCGVCGNPYVTAVLPEGVNLREWVVARLDEIERWQSIVECRITKQTEFNHVINSDRGR